MAFQQDAAIDRLERSVRGSRRAAGIGIGIEAAAAFAVFVVADDQVALELVNLFPVVMGEGGGRVDAGLELEQPRAAAGLVLFVEILNNVLLELYQSK